MYYYVAGLCISVSHYTVAAQCIYYVVVCVCVCYHTILWQLGSFSTFRSEE